MLLPFIPPSKDLYLPDYTGFFILPVTPGLQRPVEPDRSGTRAVIDAATAIPAFVRMKYNGRFALLGVGDIDIYLANLHAVITPVASIRIEQNHLIGCRDIGDGH